MNTIIIGAPYLPTLRSQQEIALDLLGLKKGQTLLELGCGDGKVMRAAAQRGYKVIGVEINPILVVISRLRTYKYKKHCKVIWGNYWDMELPECDGIYVFLIDKYMSKLDKKISKSKLGTVKLASYAFQIPNKKPTAVKNGVYLYTY